MKPSVVPVTVDLLRAACTRRTALVLLAIACTAPWGAQAQAQAPKNPTRIIVGFPPGGTIDQVARLYADELAQRLGVTAIVENHSGAGGQLAIEMLLRVGADGGTLLVANDHMISTLPLTTPSVKYDPVNDLEPVSMLAGFEVVLAVNGALGVSNYGDYVARMRRDPKAGSYGVPAPGSVPQFIGFSIGRREKLPMVSVPYRGAAPLMVDLLGGHIAAGILTYSNDLLEHQRTGRLRMIAITGAKRSPVLPDVPTFAQLGYTGVDRSRWMGLFAPRGTPRPVIERLSKVVLEAGAKPALGAALDKIGLTVRNSTPQELRQAIRDELAVWGPVIKASGYVAK
ncbi:MAG: Twin-arginine translocation pathway signal [Burkholderiales bacterium]|nr:Twin-arginine translocation pathway signal [Burkholderiales bacterium]